MPIGTDFKIDVNGDIDLTGGDIDQVVDVAQAIENELCLVVGEWFLDLDAGVPYYQEFLIKAPIIDHLEQVIRDKVLGFDEVSEIASMELDFDPETRSLSITFAAEGVTGLLDGSFTL